jgi:hypothetical protein
MQLFQTYFPNEPGLMMFKVHYSDEEQIDVDKTFQPLFEMQRIWSEDFEKALQMYQNRTLPIVSLSKLAGRNLIETFGALINSTAFGIFCCSGTHQETQEAVTLALSSSSLILDTTAIFAVHQLGLESAITNSYPELFVVRTTVDFLKALSQQLPTHPMIKIEDDLKKGKLFIFDDENQLRFNHNSLQRMIEWVESNCKILPTTGRLLENRQEQIDLRQGLGDCFLDTILAAQEQSITLYSDDHILRSVAQQKYDVKGIWSQIILERLARDGAISSELHELAVIELACLNYRHTAINAKVLIRAARLASWNQAYPLESVWSTLSPAKSNMSSALQVAVEFVYLLWREKLPLHQYENLVMGILTAITSSATITNQYLLLEKFEAILANKLHLAPVAVSQLEDIVANWRHANLY